MTENPVVKATGFFCPFGRLDGDFECSGEAALADGRRLADVLDRRLDLCRSQSFDRPVRTMLVTWGTSSSTERYRRVNHACLYRRPTGSLAREKTSKQPGNRAVAESIVSLPSWSVLPCWDF